MSSGKKSPLDFASMFGKCEGCFYCVMKEPPHKQPAILKKTFKEFSEMDPELQLMWCQALSSMFSRDDPRNANPLLGEYLKFGMIDALFQALDTCEDPWIPYYVMKLFADIAITPSCCRLLKEHPRFGESVTKILARSKFLTYKLPAIKSILFMGCNLSFTEDDPLFSPALMIPLLEHTSKITYEVAKACFDDDDGDSEFLDVNFSFGEQERLDSYLKRWIHIFAEFSWSTLTSSFTQLRAHPKKLMEFLQSMSPEQHTLLITNCCTQIARVAPEEYLTSTASFSALSLLMILFRPIPELPEFFSVQKQILEGREQMLHDALSAFLDDTIAHKDTLMKRVVTAIRQIPKDSQDPETDSELQFSVILRRETDFCNLIETFSRVPEFASKLNLASFAPRLEVYAGKISDFYQRDFFSHKTTELSSVLDEEFQEFGEPVRGWSQDGVFLPVMWSMPSLHAITICLCRLARLTQTPCESEYVRSRFPSQYVQVVTMVKGFLDDPKCLDLMPMAPWLDFAMLMVEEYYFHAFSTDPQEKAQKMVQLLMLRARSHMIPTSVSNPNKENALADLKEARELCAEGDPLLKEIESLCNNLEAEKRCAVCSRLGKSGKLLRCSRCKVMPYCSKECQVKDWKTHKNVCVIAQ